MAESQGRTRQNSAPLSDGDTYRELDFDSALEKIESKLHTVEDELDDSVDDASEQTHTDEEPEDDYLDEIEESVEANTPDDDYNDLDEEPLQESPERKKKTEVVVVKDTTKKPSKGRPQSDDDDEDEEVPLSRKQRGKLITELRDQLAEEQRQNALLQAQAQEIEKDNATLDAEVARALGTQEEFDQVMEAALSGDEDAQELARKWKNNRAFYGKLVSKAKKDTASEFMAGYWDFIKDLPGITPDTIQKAPNLGQLLRNIHGAGVGSVTDKDADKMAELETKLETLRGKYKALKTQKGGRTRSPITSGGESVDDMPFNWRAHYLDKDTGLMTDEADKLVQQYGFEALRTGKLLKKR